MVIVRTTLYIYHELAKDAIEPNSAAWRGAAADDLDSIFALALAVPQLRPMRDAAFGKSHKKSQLQHFPLVRLRFLRRVIASVRPRGLPQAVGEAPHIGTESTIDGPRDIFLNSIPTSNKEIM